MLQSYFKYKTFIDVLDIFKHVFLCPNDRLSGIWLGYGQKAFLVSSIRFKVYYYKPP